MRMQLSAVLAAVSVVFASFSSTRAIDITFDLTQLAFNNPTSSLTSGGYTLLFSSTSGTLSGTTLATYGGLQVNGQRSFTIQKNAGPTDLIFKSYTIGNTSFASGNTLTFDLTGGTGTSNGNTFAPITTLNYYGSYTLIGSQTVTFALNNFSNNIPNDKVNFNALTFSSVPEPSTYALATIATGVMAAIARRRKSRKA